MSLCYLCSSLLWVDAPLVYNTLNLRIGCFQIYDLESELNWPLLTGYWNRIWMRMTRKRIYWICNSKNCISQKNCFFRPSDLQNEFSSVEFSPIYTEFFICIKTILHNWNQQNLYTIRKYIVFYVCMYMSEWMIDMIETALVIKLLAGWWKRWTGWGCTPVSLPLLSLLFLTCSWMGGFAFVALKVEFWITEWHEHSALTPSSHNNSTLTLWLHCTNPAKILLYCSTIML